MRGELMSAVLLVANQTLAGGQVSEYVQSRMLDEPAAFTLLVPATGRAHLEKSTRLLGDIAYSVATAPGKSRDTENADYEHARGRLEYGLSTLRNLGATVDGVVGDPHPLKAIAEAFERRHFDEVVVFTLPRAISRWLRLDLSHQAERRFHVPVTVITAGRAQLRRRGHPGSRVSSAAARGYALTQPLDRSRSPSRRCVARPRVAWVEVQRSGDNSAPSSRGMRGPSYAEVASSIGASYLIRSVSSWIWSAT
jgi:hypothetical protein